MAHEIIHPIGVHSTHGVGYSHVAKVGHTLYIGGQIALDRQGKIVGPGDIEAQTRQVYANLRSILEELGGGLRSIVKLTTYLTDRRHLQGFRNVRNEVFPPPLPPNTLLFINGLASPDYLVEIEAIAVLDGVRRYDAAMPNASLLETFANPHPARDYVIEHVADEFTSVCPKTGHPDFGSVTLRYVAGDRCVELKSLKLYYQSFRNEGIFYEAVTNRIADDLAAAMQPRWMVVTTDWKGRGGIRSRIQVTVGEPRN